MSDSDVDDLRTLVRREPILTACEAAPLTRRELTERADVSRTTAYRATVSLTKARLLEQCDGGYQTTTRGSAVRSVVEQYRAGVETVERLEPLLALVDAPELLAHVHLLRDAEVVVADATNPYRIVDRALERFEATDSSRGTIASATSAEALDRSVPALDDKQSFERVFAASALEAHETVGGDIFDEATASDGLSVLVADGDAVPFSFAIDDDGVTLVGHDPATGLPTVHVESERPEARAWLGRVYERCRERARPL